MGSQNYPKKTIATEKQSSGHMNFVARLLKGFKSDEPNLLLNTPNGKESFNYDYVSELKRLIKNKNVTNIALEGDYGTGKSSILKQLVKSWRFRLWYRPKTISFLTLDADKLLDQKGKGGDDDSSVYLKAKNTKLEATINNGNSIKEGSEKAESSPGMNNNDHLSPEITNLIQTEIVKQLFYGEKPNRTKFSQYKRLGRTHIVGSTLIATMITYGMFALGSNLCPPIIKSLLLILRNW